MSDTAAQARADNDAQGQLAPDGTPVSGSRIGSLDFIRGIAVLGILAANIIAFGQPFGAYMWPEAFLSPPGPYSDTLWLAQFVFIDGKMRALFAILFGAGMYLFLQNAWAKGLSSWLQARRLAFLLAFGLIHFFFIWKGDILVYYALTGLIALMFVKMRAETQLKLGILGYIAGAILYAGMMVPLHFIADTPFGENAAMSETRAGLEETKRQVLHDDKVESAIISDGDYSAYVTHNLVEHGPDPLINMLIFGIEILPLMLLGMALYRIGMFDGQLDRKEQRMWGWLGLGTGAALSLGLGLWALSTGPSYYGSLAAFVGLSPIPRLMMALGLAALLALYTPRAKGWLGERLSAAGRMAFSNYLGTSILMISVFHGWGLGLFGELTRAQLYLVVLGAWIVMLAWSKPWLGQFRYGPLEWLWRCLTYGKRVPLRR
ncbi:DUF418 domain-containing protein [Pontixanthobacter luteolus]|uniref:DUF418 domain-containing protein n=1 Tax=Pontixanthobacter luteolus TaxID=295089 RepID=UPI002303E0AF|nr:DUF418 domain-containing protein [Pontixanthobacter luteolus]